MNLISSMCSKHDFFYGMNQNHMASVGMMSAVLMGKNELNLISKL